MEIDPARRINFSGILASSLSEWVRLCLVVSLFLGFAFGFVTLVFALCGWQATADMGVLQLRGIPAGLANLVWAPVLFGTVSIPLALISYLPLRFVRNLLP